MRSFGSAIWKVAGVASMAALMVVGTSDMASAGTATVVTGQVVCDVDGNQSVTWKFTNNTQLTAVIGKATVDHSLLTSGSIGDANVNMNPFTVPSLQSAVGNTFTSLNTLGRLTLSVIWNNGGGDVTSTTFVDLVGCVASPTTAAATTAAPTTTTAPTTTATAAGAATTAPTTTAPTTTAAPVTTQLANSGGTLPASGNGDTLPIVAAVLVAAGAVLMLVRRRISL